jgi:hypothetical protein
VENLIGVDILMENKNNIDINHAIISQMFLDSTKKLSNILLNYLRFSIVFLLSVCLYIFLNKESILAEGDFNQVISIIQLPIIFLFGFIGCQFLFINNYLDIGGRAIYSKYSRDDVDNLIKKADSDNDLESIKSLASLYSNGEWLPKNQKNRYYYLCLASDLGCAESTYELSQIFRYGCEGITINRQMEYETLLLAKERNYLDAVVRINELTDVNKDIKTSNFSSGLIIGALFGISIS